MDCETSIRSLAASVCSISFHRPSFCVSIRGLSETYCYSSRAVLEIELAGYRLLGELLAELVPAAVKTASDRCQHEHKLLRLLPRIPDENDRLRSGAAGDGLYFRDDRFVCGVAVPQAARHFASGSVRW